MVYDPSQKDLGTAAGRPARCLIDLVPEADRSERPRIFFGYDPQN